MDRSHAYPSLLDTTSDDADIAHPIGTPRDLDDALLAALAAMAVRSQRRQADLVVAVRRAGLTARPEVLHAALARLHADGSVDGVLQLADGGVLVSVTLRGIDRLSHTARRHVVAGT